MQKILNILILLTIFISGAGCKEDHKTSDQTDENAETVFTSDSTSTRESRLAAGEPELSDLPNYDAAIKYITKSPDAEKYKKGIIPKVLKQDFDYGRKLIVNQTPGFIIVDKCEMTVTLYDRYGNSQLSYGMACARNFGSKHKKADSRTPEGFFSVEGIYDSTDWLYTDDYGHTSQTKGQFGPRFIRIKCPATSQIGIHGTGSPWSIGHRVSHGCIRIENENILELVKHVSVGMPIIVNPSPKDHAVNVHEGYHIPLLKLGNRPDSFYEYNGPLPREIIDRRPAPKSNDSIVSTSEENIPTDVEHPKVEVIENAPKSVEE